MDRAAPATRMDARVMPRVGDDRRRRTGLVLTPLFVAQRFVVTRGVVAHACGGLLVATWADRGGGLFLRGIKTAGVVRQVMAGG